MKCLTTRKVLLLSVGVNRKTKETKGGMRYKTKIVTGNQVTCQPIQKELNNLYTEGVFFWLFCPLRTLREGEDNDF